MTRHLFIFILTFLFFSCSTKEKRKIVKTFPSGKTEKEIIYPNPTDTLNYSEVTYFENGQTESNKGFHSGRFNGKIIEYYENGKKKFEGTTEMSSFIGTKFNYDENGKLTQTDSLFTKCDATDCCCDGIVTRFYPNGKIKEQFTNKSGMITGVTTTFYENGQMESQRHFVDDKEDGISKYWSENGKLTKEKNYHSGFPDGTTIEYYDNYKVQGQYINGKEEGEWKFIDSLGKVIQIEVYKNGIKIK
jgi:antitoxin component YwqK of YwqJK toxin-antitoxin module